MFFFCKLNLLFLSLYLGSGSNHEASCSRVSKQRGGMLVPAEAKQDKTLPKKHESAEIILPPFAEHPESRKKLVFNYCNNIYLSLF